MSAVIAPVTTTAAPGVDGPASAAVAPVTKAKPAAASRSNATALPDIDVLHVPTGSTVSLRSQLVADTPTLLWFWAPHCTFCMREAPKLKAFAEKYGDKIRVLGVGAQDTRGQAADFVESTETQNLAMLWDQSGESWISFNVTNQPTVIVLSRDGDQRARFFRNFDEDAILKAAGLSA